jgi:hypothetical protein
VTANPARLSNEQLLEKSHRRAILTAGYQPPDGSQITVQDCQDADPRVVDAWLEAGRLTHLGMAPRRRRP